MITRILWLLATFLLAHVQLAAAQHPAKIHRLGFLFFGSRDQPDLESFHRGLRVLGYIDGKNISIEYRYAERSSDRVAALATELVALSLDVILTTTPAATRAVLQATSGIPIIGIGFDPIATGLIKSLARPGGMVTGLSSSAGSEMMGSGWICSRRRSRRSPQWRCCESRSWPACRAGSRRGKKRRSSSWDTTPASRGPKWGRYRWRRERIEATSAGRACYIRGRAHDSKFKTACRSRDQTSLARDVSNGTIYRRRWADGLWG